MKQRIIPGMLLLLFIILSSSFLVMPTAGDYDHPARNSTTRRYIEHAGDDTNTANVVNGIITDYRAIDTLGEATVLLAGATAVVTVLAGYRKTGKAGNRRVRN